MVAVTLKPSILSQQTIEAVRALQRAEGFRLRLLFLLAFTAMCGASFVSPETHPVLRVCIAVLGLATCVCWGVRNVRLERRTYFYRPMPTDQAARLLALSAEFPACHDYLRALREAGRPLIGDDEYQLVALDPGLAHEWQHLERDACARSA